MIFQRHFLIACAAQSLCALAAPAQPDGWSVVSKSADLVICERAREGTPHREFRATGKIAAKPEAVLRLLDDVAELPRFIPFLAEARVVGASGGARLIYQRISMPLLDDRDYTLRAGSGIRREKNGAATCCQRWTTADGYGPPRKKGVVRVKVAEGSWELKPASDGGTLAVYTSFSDPGGDLPAMLTNRTARQAVRKLFDAVRREAGRQGRSM